MINKSIFASNIFKIALLNNLNIIYNLNLVLNGPQILLNFQITLIRLCYVNKVFCKSSFLKIQKFLP